MSDLFVPPALAGAGAPEFLLRPAAEVSLVDAIAAAGLRQHSTDDLRTEAVRALKGLWRGEVRREALRRLRGLWRRLDRGEVLLPDDDGALRDLSERIGAASPRFLAMGADNAEFPAAVLGVAVSLVVEGWRGLPVEPEMADGRMTLQAVRSLELHFRSLGPTGTAAWAELVDAATLLLSPPLPLPPAADMATRRPGEPSR